MKRLMFLMCILFSLVFVFSSTMIVASAEEEVNSSGVVGSNAVVEENTENNQVQSGAVIEESTETKSLTAEELKEIVDKALNEQQKSYLDKISTAIANKFGVSNTLVYVVLSTLLIALFALIFLIGKIVAISKSKLTTGEKLKATQALLNEKINEYDEVVKALQNGNKDKLDELVQEHIAPEIATISDKVTEDVVARLKFDSQTQGKLLASTINNANKLAKIIEALKVLAVKSNNKELANALSDRVEDAEYERVILENQKLKVALGETKVNEVLADEKIN